MTNKKVAVIMAGGSGERFWPVSRSHYPKQLLKITSDHESMLQEAVSRAIPLFSEPNIMIATSLKLRDSIVKGESRIPEDQVLGEPNNPTTTGCLVWAAANIWAKTNDPETVMAVLTADHRIGDGDKFRACLEQAVQIAAQEKQIVTIGAKPDRPETAYGYIEAGEEISSDDAKGYRVNRFREKPNQESADQFLAEGNYYWNCGMFFWTVETFFNELREHAPEIFGVAREILEALKQNDHKHAVEAFDKLPNLSIDYALLEHTNHVVCVPATFEWDDVGSWDSLDRYRSKDEQENVKDGNVILEDVESSIVINEATKDQVVAVVGMEDVVVINTDDAVLVVPKDKVQNVKKIVTRLKDSKASQI